MKEKLLPLLKEILLETLWPSRCALCDRPGKLLCAKCRMQLQYIDALDACPVCGSPHGRVQCCDCSTTMLGPLEYEAPPFEACVSAVQLDVYSGRMVSLYKDSGEVGLAETFAGILLAATPPSWRLSEPVVSYIPASPGAFLRRGWDHAERLAQAYAKAAGLGVSALFERPAAKDQRSLTRVERFSNMREAVRLLEGTAVPERVILVDDVYTTGSTLFAAAEALKAAGTKEVFCLTFGRA